MKDDDGERATRAVATRVSEKLYAFLEEEQARLAESGIKMPISGVARMVLERARKAADEASTPRRKVATTK